MQLARWLKSDARTKNLLWWHTPNEGRRTPFERYLVGIMGNKKGVSDFIIIERRNGYSGLAIELKRPNTKIFKRNGDPYFPEQHEFLESMKKQGFMAGFKCGFEEAQGFVLEFLNHKNNKS